MTSAVIRQVASIQSKCPFAGFRRFILLTMKVQMPTNANINIRALTRDDFDAWSPLWNGYNAFYGRQGATALPIEITRMTWERFFDPYEPMFAIVAEQNGGLIGLAHYLYHRSTTQIGPSCYLQDLFTMDKARGQGVGRRLIGEITKIAKSEGISRLYWHTYEKNETAMLLYDKVAEKTGVVLYRQVL